MDNKFICRGITNDNKFVYGYYAKIEKRHYIFSAKNCAINNFVDEHFSRIYGIIEITKEPDRSLEFKDKNGKKLYEKDIYLHKGMKFTASITSFKNKDIEIIGNAHNIKEEN